jgi:alpha-methylacyl-CoA racemase
MLDGGAPFYDTYRCADGRFVAIGAIEAPFYATLRELGELAPSAPGAQMDPSTWSASRAELEGLFARRTRDDWCAVFEGSDTCFAPVLDWDEAPRHPHNSARETFVTIDGVVQPGPAPRFSRTASSTPRSRDQIPSPVDVLRDWSVDADVIARLGRP